MVETVKVQGDEQQQVPPTDSNTSENTSGKGFGDTSKSDSKKESSKKGNKKGKKAKDFRLASKTVLLTYPQCPIPLDLMFEKITTKELFTKYGILNYAIVLEMHEDGNPHIHALIEFSKKIDTKNPRFFDLVFYKQSVDESGAIVQEPLFLHGSYEGAKSKVNALQYVTKEIFNTQDAANRLRLSQGFSIQLGALYQYLSLEERMIWLAEHGKINEAMDLLKTEDPKDFLLRGNSVEKRMQELHMKKMGYQSKYPFDSFTMSPELKQALMLFERSLQLGEGRVLAIVGSPRTGKSEFLKAYFEQVFNAPTLVVSHREALKSFDPHFHKAVIFDDPQFESEGREQLIQMMDCNQQDVKIRYNLVRIPSNLPKALTSNKELNQVNPWFSDEAIDQRMIVYQMEPQESLFPQGFVENESPISKDRKQLKQEINQYKQEIKSKRKASSPVNKYNR